MFCCASNFEEYNCSLSLHFAFVAYQRSLRITLSCNLIWGFHHRHVIYSRLHWLTIYLELICLLQAGQVELKCENNRHKNDVLHKYLIILSSELHSWVFPFLMIFIYTQFCATKLDPGEVLPLPHRMVSPNFFLSVLLLSIYKPRAGRGDVLSLYNLNKHSAERDFITFHIFQSIYRNLLLVTYEAVQ